MQNIVLAVISGIVGSLSESTFRYYVVASLVYIACMVYDKWSK
jgi:hypothetical protein